MWLLHQPLSRWLVLAVVAGCALRYFRLAMLRPLWCDEAYIAVSLLSRGWSTLFTPLEYGQVASFGFLAVSWLGLQILPAGEVALRLPSLVAGIAALVLFPWAIRPLATREVRLFATILLAVSIFPVRLASELKPYAIDLLFSVVILACAARSIRLSTSLSQPLDAARKSRRFWFAALLVVNLLVPWISFPGVFVAGGMIIGLFLLELFPPIPRYAEGVSLLVPVNGLSGITRILPWKRDEPALRGKRGLIHALVLGIPLVLSTCLMWHLFGRDAYEHGNQVMNLKIFWRDAMPANYSPVELLRWLAEAHTGAMFAYPVGAEHGASIVTSIAVLLGIWRLARRQPEVLAIALPAFALTAFAALLQKYPYGGSARVAQHLAPFICLLVGYGTAFILPRWSTHRRRLCHLAILLVGFGLVVGQADYFVRRPAKDPNDTSLRATLAGIREEAPRDVRLLCAGEDFQLPFALYDLGSEQGAKFRANRLLGEHRVSEGTAAPATTGVAKSTPHRVLLFSRKHLSELPTADQEALQAALPPDGYRLSKTCDLVPSNRDGLHKGYIFVFDQLPPTPPSEPQSPPNAEAAPQIAQGGN
jgi:hypothetical protein